MVRRRSGNIRGFRFDQPGQLGRERTLTQKRHDGIGLEDYQCGRADRLALDYHGGQTFFGDPEAMLARVMQLIAEPDQMQTIGRAAFDVLLATSGADRDRLGAVGYGYGASIVLKLATAEVPFMALAAVHPALPTAHPEEWANGTDRLGHSMHRL